MLQSSGGQHVLVFSCDARGRAPAPLRQGPSLEPSDVHPVSPCHFVQDRRRRPAAEIPARICISHISAGSGSNGSDSGGTTAAGDSLLAAAIESAGSLMEVHGDMTLNSTCQTMLRFDRTLPPPPSYQREGLQAPPGHFGWLLTVTQQVHNHTQACVHTACYAAWSTEEWRRCRQCRPPCGRPSLAGSRLSRPYFSAMHPTDLCAGPWLRRSAPVQRGDTSLGSVPRIQDKSARSPQFPCCSILTPAFRPPISFFPSLSASPPCPLH